MIKVEVKEGNFEVNTNSATSPPSSRASPQNGTSAVTFTPSPPSSAAASAAHFLPQLTPMPPLLRGGKQTHPFPPLLQMPHQASAMEEMMAKSNLFHFGDVAVVNHPDAPPVPMVLPMAYLLPIPGASKDFRYRMFVPMGDSLPPVMPQMPPNGAATTNVSPPRKRKASASSSSEDIGQKKDQRPLDLSKGSEDEMEAEEVMSKQQREIEAHLNFIKAKQLEILKQQQQQQQISPPLPQLQSKPPLIPIPMTSESRCEECNINFSKYQNYVAHKKYYCSAGEGVKQPSKDQDEANKNIKRTNVSKSPAVAAAAAASDSLIINNGAKANTNSLTSPRSPQAAGRTLASPSANAAAAAAAAAAATAALQGILGMSSSAASATSPSPEATAAANFSKEMMLFKQHQGRQIINRQILSCLL
jgi:hypothetical protein